jgi:hypothetical protein
MMGAYERYSELLVDLVLTRALAGGNLPDLLESEYAENLDRCWWAMSEEERLRAEVELAPDLPPVAAAELDEVDVAVEQGQHTPPRKAA